MNIDSSLLECCLDRDLGTLYDVALITRAQNYHDGHKRGGRGLRA
ncbi:hypothetical protein [Helicobacter vulpis]|nr:hypothetical protein [Helicobacter vulpis]